MKQIYVVLLLISLAIALLSCGSGSGSGSDYSDNSEVDTTTAPESPLESTPSETNTTPADAFANALPPCTINSNCTTDKYCLNGQCLLLSEINNNNGCSKTCRLTNVKIYTSDKETYFFNPGQGSYAAGGAINWKIMSIPPYCVGEKVRVPLSISVKNYDTVYRDNLVALEKGETSEYITHPLVPSIKLTLKVVNVTEECQ